MKDHDRKELLAKGYLHCKIIFEMAGNPKEHVETTLKKYIDKVKEDPSYIFSNEYYSPCEENEDHVWSLINESDVYVENLEKLNVLAFNLGPASIEFIAPEEFRLTEKQMTDVYNDLLSKLHETSIAIKSAASENDLLKVNLNRLIRNCVVLGLSEPRDIDSLSQKVGIDNEHLQPFIDAMIKEKSIHLVDGKYHINKN